MILTPIGNELGFDSIGDALRTQHPALSPKDGAMKAAATEASLITANHLAKAWEK